MRFSEAWESLSCAALDSPCAVFDSPGHRRRTEHLRRSRRLNCEVFAFLAENIPFLGENGSVALQHNEWVTGAVKAGIEAASPRLVG
jgi:hypothetical protein